MFSLAPAVTSRSFWMKLQFRCLFHGPYKCVQLFQLRSRLPTELYEVSPGPVLKYIKIPLEYSSAICHVNHSPLIYYPLQICWGCTLCHDLGHWWRHSLTFTDRYPLSLLVQSVPNPVFSFSPLFLSFQTRVLWETIKSLTKVCHCMQMSIAMLGEG